MNIVTHSSSSSKTSFTLFCPQKHNNHNVSIISKVSLKVPTKTTLTIPCSTKQASPVIDQKPLSAEPQTNRKESAGIPEGTLVVRRPVLENSGESDVEGESSSSGIFDAGLEEFAKKMAMFEPGRGESSASSQEKPLVVNLDLALYKARLLARNFRYKEAEEILQKCISIWPEDGRVYVSLGKTLSKQSKWKEARSVYEKGCQATQGENPYIWQCWAVLEDKVGNLRRARELFDAATVADKRHIAAWHGWAILELKQGNVKKARQLLGKGIRFCGGNEYIYQTLALLEAKANRFKQARYLFSQAIRRNPRSCASWLAWAQVEMRQGNNLTASKLFEKAVQASPKNRYAWHAWGLFEENLGDVEKARKLLKIGHALNPRDPVLLQSLGLLEYKHSTANLARLLFRKASELDPRHQAVWFAWGWMEWKEGNIPTARKLYQKVLEIDTTTEGAARCLQAWGVLEQRAGNLSAARRLFRSSLNVNSQSYVTWRTWAQLEEDQGNAVRAEEIRNLYFQQRTEVVDDASWVMGFMDIIDPAVDTVRRFLKLDQNPSGNAQVPSRNMSESNDSNGEDNLTASTPTPSSGNNSTESRSGLDLDSFIRERLFLDPTKLDVQLHTSRSPAPRKPKWRRKA